VVFDASTITSYLLEQARRDDVYGVMRTTLERGCRLLTIDLAYKEVANALWRACVLRNMIDEKTVIDSLNSLYGLPLEPIRQDGALVTRAVEISLESKLSVYDSVYVAVAEREKADLFTLDEKQRLKAKKYVNTRPI
jgi:predicted nucleic acid-binding protein